MRKNILYFFILGFFCMSCNQNEDFDVKESPFKENNNKEKGWISFSDSKRSVVNYLNNISNNKAKNTDIPKFTERDIKETIGIQDDKDNTLIYIHNLNLGGFVTMSGSI